MKLRETISRRNYLLLSLKTPYRNDAFRDTMLQRPFVSQFCSKHVRTQKHTANYGSRYFSKECAVHSLIAIRELVMQRPPRKVGPDCLYQTLEVLRCTD